MKLFLIFIFVSFLSYSQTNNFELVYPISPDAVNSSELFGVKRGTVNFADIDNDGDMDVLITGFNQVMASKLYINDGTGNFLENTNVPFTESNQGAVVFLDIDGDNNLDLIITGKNFSTISSQIFINDGSGNFTESSVASIDDVYKSSLDYSDIDGDNDFDLIVTGLNNSNQNITKLYLNDGLGAYTEVIGTLFDGVKNGDSKFCDIDGDGDEDLLIVGENNLDELIAKIYINDGVGNYTESFNSGLTGVYYGEVDFGDIDGDGDFDLLISGHGVNVCSTTLYYNDGNGVYSINNLFPFENVWKSSVRFSDIDNDNDLDVVIIGSNNLGTEKSKFYLNDGIGNFLEDSLSNLHPVDFSAIDIADIDNDNDNDLIITGSSGSLIVSKIYIWDASVSFFKEARNSPFVGASNGSVEFGDIDNDNDLDVLLTGTFGISGYKYSNLYINDGNGNFSYKIDSLIGVTYSNGVFQDIDNDGDQDVIISGHVTQGLGYPITKLYLNDGMGNFMEDVSSPFENVKYGSIIFSDIENDNDGDMVLTGKNVSNQLVTKLYINDGSGNFAESPLSSSFHQGGDALFSDVDGDGDDDLLICGESVHLYLNDGLGNYSEFQGMTGFQFTGTGASEAAFIDIDMDGIQEIVYICENTSSETIVKLYRYFPLLGFSEISNPFIGLSYSDIKVSDYDNDGDNDVYFCGATDNEVSKTLLYANDGLGNFVEVLGLPFDQLRKGYISIGDVDNDNHEDIIYCGEGLNDASYHTKLFKNKSCANINYNDTIFACDSYTWIDGITYTQSNNTAQYTVSGVVSDYCDSVLTLNLTIFSSSNLIDSQFSCNSYTWIDGVTYYLNNNTATFIAEGGCEITLNLTIPNPGTSFDYQTACESYTWIDGNTYTSSNNTASYLMEGMASNGCDSIVTLDLIIISPSYSVDYQVSCDPYIWMDGITYYINNNTASFLMEGMASNGCDSIVTLDLTMIYPSYKVDYQSSCESYTWIDGNTYTSSNNTASFLMEGMASNGCDSIVTLDLTINTVDVTTIIDDPTITSYASNASFKWLDCNNDFLPISTEISSSFTPIQNGDFAVEVTQNNCVDTSNCVTIYTVGFIDQNLNEIVTILPNPSSELFNIYLGDLNNVTILVYSFVGNIVFEERNINIQIYELKLNQSPGIYIIELSNDLSKIQSKVILE